MPENPSSPPPFQIPEIPGLSLQTSIGEIAKKIGRQLALEQDTLVHKFAEKHPDVILDDLVICHGFFQGERISGSDHATTSHYRVWIEIMTPEEKAQRDLQRRCRIVEPELLKASRELTEHLGGKMIPLDPNDVWWDQLRDLRKNLNAAIARVQENS